MKHLYQAIIAPYVSGEYSVFLRARYLRFVNIALVAAVPAIVAGNLVFLEGWNIELLLPLGLLFLVSTLNLLFLAKGKLALASHVLFWSFMGGVWAIMFTDQGTALVRTNTIVFAFAVLSMLPLLVQHHRFLIPLYYGLNLTFFLSYAIWDYGKNDITELEIYDYILDTMISMVFFAIAAHGIFTVSQKALGRVQQEMDTLKKTRQLLNGIIESMPSVLLSVDAHVAVTSWNHMAEALTNTPASKAIGAHLFDVFPLLESRKEAILLVVGGESTIEEKKITLSPDNNARLYNITVYPLVDEKKAGAVIRLDDVSEQVALEHMVVQNEKMLSVGGLAAGMAHEINNPLGGILQSIQVITQRIDPGSHKNRIAAQKENTDIETVCSYLKTRGIYTLLENMNVSARTAARIVSNMLSFSRKNNGKKKLCDVVRLFDESVQIAGTDYSLKNNYDFKKIKIVKNVSEELPLVLCEPGKIQQVFLNILRNGAQAMANISKTGETPTFWFSGSPQNNIIYVRIRDNGPGMEKDVQRRIFEPFFTNKEVGKGTGLGLSVSYFIVSEEHGGTLTVSSQLGEGTEFTIGLPLSNSMEPTRN